MRTVWRLEPFSTLRSWHMLSDAINSYGDSVSEKELAVLSNGRRDMVEFTRKSKRAYIFPEVFAGALQDSIRRSVALTAVPHSSLPSWHNVWDKTRNWFLSGYPLLGALAADFRLVRGRDTIRRLGVSIAAVSPQLKEIYVNPDVTLSEDECRFVLAHEFLHVVLDTSGSMERSLLAAALGAVASYSDTGDVNHVCVVFCDAAAYDQGVMSPRDLAGEVQVYGRGGTVLQPGIDLLDNDANFPQEAPVLIITDGECDRLNLRGREHAYLVPKGKRLPFPPRGPVLSSSAVNRNHAAVSKFQFHTSCVHIELAGK